MKRLWLWENGDYAFLEDGMMPMDKRGMFVNTGWGVFAIVNKKNYMPSIIEAVRKLPGLTDEELEIDMSNVRVIYRFNLRREALIGRTNESARMGLIRYLKNIDIIGEDWHLCQQPFGSFKIGAEKNTDSLFCFYKIEHQNRNLQTDAIRAAFLKGRERPELQVVEIWRT